DGRLGEHLGFAQHAMNQGHRYSGNAGALQNEIAHRNVSIQDCMVMRRVLAPVNTVVYGGMSHGTRMSDQLSAKDWVDQGLKALASRGFTALKAEPLAKAMRV